MDGKQPGSPRTLGTRAALPSRDCVSLGFERTPLQLFKPLLRWVYMLLSSLVLIHSCAVLLLGGVVEGVENKALVNVYTCMGWKIPLMIL